MPDYINTFSLEERIACLRQYGSHCMSFSALQPGIKYFDMPGKGYIAYAEKWGIRGVLSDPVCEEKDRETLIGEFIRRGGRTGFAQVSEPVAELLHEQFGLYATQFGVESIIDLKNWDLKGKKKQVLRTSLNQAVKSGIYVQETFEEDRYNELSREWVKTRKVRNREIRFLIRPMNMEYQVGTRKFFAYRGDDLIGFIFFDPVYSQNRVISYVPNISRFSQSFRQGIFYTIMLQAMETFKEEGVEQIHLGLSPFVVGEGYRHYESKITKQLIRLLYQYGNGIYSFKGIYFTKSRFRGKDYPTFCSHRRNLPLREIITLFRISNLL
jgi:lysylphosphatidylglycerol synthetase-like protein (DUF2156 family)